MLCYLRHSVELVAVWDQGDLSAKVIDATSRHDFASLAHHQNIFSAQIPEYVV
jgi:hypothetical protein